MKALFLTIVTLLFFVKAYSQETAKTDSAVVGLKTYLQRNVRFPAVTAENHLQGTVVISFKIDSSKNITDSHVVKSLSHECDAEVLRVFQEYHQSILLPAAEYTAGVTFLIEGSKRKSKVAPFDKSLYQNFLFDVNVVANFPY